jgi:CheY-like chemotaxis protein
VNGWEVLRTIDAEPSLQLPVIVVSASGSSRPKGVAAYLRKPFNLIELLDEVHNR